MLLEFFVLLTPKYLLLKTSELKHFQKKYKTVSKSKTQNTPIKKNSMIKKAIKYSFKLCLILFQLIKKHKAISNVVNNKKNKEIPSIPKVKFKFKRFSQ